MPTARDRKVDEGLRVVVDARLVAGESGGVEGVIAGLAHGLSSLDGPEEYLFAVWPGHEEWLAPYLDGAVRLAVVDFDPYPRRSAPAAVILRAESQLRRLVRLRPRVDEPDLRVPSFDTRIAALRPSIVHMPRQRGFLTPAPFIYHPHDLQHVHWPEFFSEEERRWRERVYGALVHRAAMVAVASEWTRNDIMNHFRLPEEKVRVVPLAPPLGAAPLPSDEVRAAVRVQYDLPDRYALYPAQTWPHKNHGRLLEALAVLRDRGVVVPLVATGMRNSHFEQVRAAAVRLDLEKQIVWTGFVPPVALRAIYQEARAIVIPSLFEAASAPLWEAFLAEIPAACSNVTSLPDQAGDAAVLFDPLNVHGMAEAIALVWSDEQVRRDVIAAGRRRLAGVTWRKTAETFRAHYRRLAGRRLSASEAALVSSTA